MEGAAAASVDGGGGSSCGGVGDGVHAVMISYWSRWMGSLERTTSRWTRWSKWAMRPTTRASPTPCLFCMSIS